MNSARWSQNQNRKLFPFPFTLGRRRFRVDKTRILYLSQVVCHNANKSIVLLTYSYTILLDILLS
jgi:hypothetical protein